MEKMKTVKKSIKSLLWYNEYGITNQPREQKAHLTDNQYIACTYWKYQYHIVFISKHQKNYLSHPAPYTSRCTAMEDVYSAERPWLLAEGDFK